MPCRYVGNPVAAASPRFIKPGSGRRSRGGCWCLDLERFAQALECHRELQAGEGEWAESFDDHLAGAGQSVEAFRGVSVERAPQPGAGDLLSHTGEA